MKAKKYTKGGFSHYTVCYRAASGDYSYAENMYIDPEGDADVLESIPGCRRLYTFESRINGIFKQGESIIVHAGERLYRFKEDERDGLTGLSPLLSMKNEKSVGACLDGRLLISDGESLVLIDGDGAQSIESADDSLKEELLAFDNKSISLCDDILFLCPEGLVNDRGELLSESINRLLLPKIDSAELCLWQGYITVFSGDRIFLCRMREGKPIWFTVSGVGSLPFHHFGKS